MLLPSPMKGSTVTTSSRPPSEKAQPRAPCLSKPKVKYSFPVATSHSLAVVSALAVTSVLESAAGNEGARQADRHSDGDCSIAAQMGDRVGTHQRCRR